MGSATVSAEGRGLRSRTWPPAAEPEGVELSAPAVLAILVGAVLAELLTFAATSGRALPTISPFGSATEAVTSQLLAPGAIVAGISVGIVLMLGWSRAAGLALGSWSWWGAVPLGLLAMAALVTARLPKVGVVGGAALGLLLLGLFLAAFAEEVIFRGFLLHGLTRRMGGRPAVLVGSTLFAGAHIPALVSQDLLDGVSLLVLFGFGVFMCRIRAATGSVWFASGVHALWNFVTVGIVGLAFSVDDIPPAFIAIKLVPVVIGLALAVRVARARPPGVPPMPGLGDGPIISRFARALPPPPRPDHP